MNPKSKLARMVEGTKLLPAHMIEGITNYLDNGIRPGSFLYSLLCYDFLGAWHRADDVNRDYFAAWLVFLVSHCPEESYGSREKVEAWIKRGGENG